MYLRKHLSPSFHPDVRQRGQELFFGGNIQIVSGNPWRVEAIVEGKPERTISLARNGNEIRMWCTCVDYLSDGSCQHIWGTIMAADAKNYLLGKLGSGAPYIAGGLAVADPPLPPPAWKKVLDDVNSRIKAVSKPAEAVPFDRVIYYFIEGYSDKLRVSLEGRERLHSGSFGKPKPLRMTRLQLPAIPDPEDREIISLLAGPESPNYGWADPQIADSFNLNGPLALLLLPRICATGRCVVRKEADEGGENFSIVSWDDHQQPWELVLDVSSKEEFYALEGRLERGGESMSLDEPKVLIADGLLVARDRISRLDHGGAFSWISALRKEKWILIPHSHGSRFLEEFLKSPLIPRAKWPEDLRYEDVRTPPRPAIKFAAPKFQSSIPKMLGHLSFEYGDHTFQPSQAGEGVFDAANAKFIRRDRAAESAAITHLSTLGLKRNSYDSSGTGWEISAKRLPSAVRELIKDGWHIEAEGKIFRPASSFRAELTSGIDWFELHGSIDYGDGAVPLPQLIKALHKGESLIQLDDGSYGLLPEELLGKYGMLMRMGKAEGDHLRFSKVQTSLLDVLLAQREDEVSVDETFRKARQQLHAFDGVHPAPQPEGFVGELRGYQCEGLGWMDFLQKLGWGGCLADDMGVGKTAQALALLETRRQLAAGPSLVVVPRSLIYNWKQESARFTPGITVLDHSGADRVKDPQHFSQYNLVLMTYGTLRRDIVSLREFPFDYVILDEAQAIKNAGSESAKAVRLLKANHRLALSGTPIENHLGELWSLFEFLNPGMLGGVAVFQSAASMMRNPDEPTRQLLSRAVRPFILRRTKDQVVKELPAKTDQTLYCELDPPQRKLYDELRNYYRLNLMGRVESKGMSGSKFQILEALLRLRQMACHPGLIDKTRLEDSSAKLDLLLPLLDEVTEEGHKALVFSQFTSLLAIVRARLGAAGVVYEYLDGATRDRQAHVERFQTDPSCKLFLISLKAGGLGLNLTAADYVFLLDPWWNPAVEAQAIDRTHRIGQTRPVFAYRLIARDTVEEKVVELQKSKRDLADAIISEDKRLVSNLTKEDLELLFS